MKCNMGIADRIIRMIVGIAIAVTGYYYDSWWAFVALVPLMTAYLGHCAIYRLFGWSTVSKQRNKPADN
ncbi:MAG: DUF2892 domain-containing protein [Deltaproteobacteria bacterium]|nr:DUF2892 domain-containing protein [Deltaproteobacteria bacterium]MBN2673808.1 DUF2892 domain-containing protein [Deltaproteobacteria bacterium]